jgi:hypothetical protein
MTIDITQIKIKTKDTGVYCENILVGRFYNEAEAIIWLSDLSIRGLNFPHELRQCGKKEKANKNHLLKFIKK